MSESGERRLGTSKAWKKRHNRGIQLTFVEEGWGTTQWMPRKRGATMIRFPDRGQGRPWQEEAFLGRFHPQHRPCTGAITVSPGGSPKNDNGPPPFTHDHLYSSSNFSLYLPTLTPALCGGGRADKKL